MFKEEFRTFLKERLGMAIDIALEDFPNWKVSDGTIDDLEDIIDKFEDELAAILMSDAVR